MSRFGCLLGFIVEQLPATLAAALLWEVWEQLEPMKRQHWLGQVLISDYLRSRGKMRTHLLVYFVGLREIPRERAGPSIG